MVAPYGKRLAYMFDFYKAFLILYYYVQIRDNTHMQADGRAGRQADHAARGDNHPRIHARGYERGGKGTYSRTG